MRTLTLIPALFLLAACGSSLAGDGEACETTADCEEGLECMDHGTMMCHSPDHHGGGDTDDTDHGDTDS